MPVAEPNRYRILILFAHPAYDKSRVNRRLFEASRGLEGVRLHDLYETYPDFHVDIKREQALLLEHDLVVFQHPFYWYSSPALLKEWMDLVLEHGWSYGRNGRALAGKYLLSAVTTGGPEQAYRVGGNNRFPMRQYLLPFDQTAHLCKMKYLAPYTVHAALTLESGGDLEAQAGHWRRTLEALRDGQIDLEAAAAADRLNPLVP